MVFEECLPFSATPRTFYSLDEEKYSDDLTTYNERLISSMWMIRSTDSSYEFAISTNNTSWSTCELSASSINDGLRHQPY